MRGVHKQLGPILTRPLACTAERAAREVEVLLTRWRLAVTHNAARHLREVNHEVCAHAEHICRSFGDAFVALEERIALEGRGGVIIIARETPVLFAPPPLLRQRQSYEQISENEDGEAADLSR